MARVFRHCQDLARARRDFDLTGAQAVHEIIKTEKLTAYERAPQRAMRQVPLQANRLVEPTATSPTVSMLERLPPMEAAFYAKEDNLLQRSFRCPIMLSELEKRFGFLGGDLEE